MLLGTQSNSHDSGKSPIGIAASGITWLIGRTLKWVDLDCSLLQARSASMLQTNHVPHWYDWVSTDMIGQRASTLPVFGQWQHAGHVPPDYPSTKRSEIGHTRYIGHASSRFPDNAPHSGGNWWIVAFVSIYPYAKLFFANRAIKSPSHSHRVKFCNVYWLA